uniref:Leukemia inhibitory factor receptor D2 domain-containing protein n=1 Tax=Coturnix japonica TaxID=93934 RepID=A0A8C2T3F7_COTJA
YLNVHKDLALQRLLVEWDVGKSAHNAELVMSFEIQVRRADEDIVWTVSALKKKLAVPLHWTWDSDLPLECMSHSVRIRSKAEASKTWSQWSLWETIPGEQNKPFEPKIFPDEKIIEQGFDISLCCVGRKGQIIKEFFLNSPIPYFNRTNSQVGLLIAKNVTFKGVPHVFCRESCSEVNCFAYAVFFVGRPPDTPRDFSCQTRNMREITCTWDQGQDTYLYGSHSSKYKLSEQYVLSLCLCSWDIGKQRIYNITLTVENPLGKRTAMDVFDVAHRSKSFSISLMKAFCGRPCSSPDLNTLMPA